MSSKPYRRFRPSVENKGDGKGKERFFNERTQGNFNVHLNKNLDVPEVVIRGCLSWNAFAILNAALHNDYQVNTRGRYVVNLSQLTEANHDGVMPLVALLSSYREMGVSIRVRLPKDYRLRGIFNDHNWSHYLDTQYLRSRRNLNRTTGIVEFDNADSLNEAMRSGLNLLLRAVTLAKGARESLEWSLNEITDNVLRHSQTGKGWFEVTWNMDGKVSCIVCDAGVGIPLSMRNAFKDIKSDEEAIAKAVEKGVTSSNEGQGNGLAGTLAIAQAGQGKLVINSRRGHFRYIKGRLKYEPMNIPFKGTYVHFSLPERQEIDLKTVLWGHEVYTYAKYEYLPDDQDAITVRLIDEASSFGNRATGNKIRVLISNLLREFSDKKVLVDFEGVEIVSSSFADELFGKFILEWGVINFSRHIGVKGANTFIEGLINTVVMQRMAQAFTEGQLRRKDISDGE